MFFLSFFSAKTTQKSLVNQGFFLLYLDAPYRDLERTFILRAIKNIEANLDIFDFDLSEEDMAVLDKIQGIKTQNDPDTVNF